MKLPHTAACSSGVDDTITVNDYAADDGEVYLTAHGGRSGTFSVFLPADEARLLAKAIKKAAKRAEAAG